METPPRKSILFRVQGFKARQTKCVNESLQPTEMASACGSDLRGTRVAVWCQPRGLRPKNRCLWTCIVRMCVCVFTHIVIWLESCVRTKNIKSVFLVLCLQRWSKDNINRHQSTTRMCALTALCERSSILRDVDLSTSVPRGPPALAAGPKAISFPLVASFSSEWEKFSKYASTTYEA